MVSVIVGIILQGWSHTPFFICTFLPFSARPFGIGKEQFVFVVYYSPKKFVFVVYHGKEKNSMLDYVK